MRNLSLSMVEFAESLKPQGSEAILEIHSFYHIQRLELDDF